MIEDIFHGGDSMNTLRKYWIVGMFILDFAGRKLISLVFGLTDGVEFRAMMLRALKGQPQEIAQGIFLQILFSALLWSLVPLWTGYRTNQRGRGCLLAGLCLVVSLLFPLLNLTPIFFGLGSYLYLELRAAREP